MAEDTLRVSLEAVDKSLTKVMKAAEREMEKMRKGAVTTSTSVDKSFKRMGASAVRASAMIYGGVKRVMRSLTSLQGLLLGGGIVIGLKKAVTASVNFEKGLAEISTLLDNKVGPSMQRYESALKEMVKTSSRSLQDLTKGLYQTISAGITDSGKALKLLDEAQKAAVAGLTDVSVAVDAGTTIVNAFGLETHEVTRAFDVLFQVVRKGKTCVTGDTRVLLADGRYERIDSMRGENDIVAWDGRNFTPATASWIAIGERETVALVTKGGRKITTTPDHPYLTQGGWKEVRELKPGDKIAVPVSLSFFGTVNPDDGWPTLLGYLISEGSLRDGSSPRFHNKDEKAIEEVRDAAEKLGVEMHMVVDKPSCKSFDLVAHARGGRYQNPIIERLRECGLWGTTCGNKFIPAECFSWRRQHIAELLRTLFNGDGWLCRMGKAERGNSLLQLGYGSKSEQLVRDISHLLTRFGIYGRVENHRGWRWITARYVDIKRFVDFIDIDRPCADLVKNNELADWTPRGFIRSSERSPNNHKQYRGMRDFKSPVYYDAIKTITPRGPETVYDLTVPSLHNFVANDIVAHNTFEPLAGAIGKVATIAAQAGVSLEEVGASISTLTKAGLNIDLATTSLRQLFANLLKPSREAKEALVALGIGYGDAALRGGNFTKTLKKMHDATGGNAEALTHLIPNIRALQAAMVLSGDQIETYTADLDAMSKSAGVAHEAFRRMSETSAEKLAIQWQRLALVMQEIGAKLLPGIVDWLTEFADWAENHGPEIVEAIDSIRGALVMVWDILTGIKNTVVGIISAAIESTPGGRILMRLLEGQMETGASHRAAGRGREAAFAAQVQREVQTATIPVGGFEGAQRRLLGAGKTGKERRAAKAGAVDDWKYLQRLATENLKFAQTTEDAGESRLHWAVSEAIQQQADALKHLIGQYETLGEVEKKNMKAALDAAEDKLAAQKKLREDAKKTYARTIKYLDRELGKRGDVFEQLDKWYQDLYKIVKNNREGLAKLDEVYFAKLEDLVGKAQALQERAAEKVTAAWAKFHKEEEAWAKGQAGIGTSTLREHEEAIRTDRRLSEAEKRRELIALRSRARGSQMGGEMLRAGGPAVQGAVQGGAAGGGIGALIGLIGAIGFTGGDTKEEQEENRKKFADDWDKRTDRMGDVAENLTKNLTHMLNSTLERLPETISRTIAKLNVGKILVDGVFRGLVKFFKNFGKEIADAFKGGVKSKATGIGLDLLTGIPTGGKLLKWIKSWHEGGVIGAQSFHDGGSVGRADGLAAAVIQRAHDGMVARANEPVVGLRRDEVPIIAQDGEGVLSRLGMQALGALNAGNIPSGQVPASNVQLNFGVVTTDDVREWADRAVSGAISEGNFTPPALGGRTGRVPGLTRRRR